MKFIKPTTTVQCKNFATFRCFFSTSPPHVRCCRTSALRYMYRLLLLIVFFCLSFSVIVSAEWAKVKYVVDGDTIILESNQRVRLLGVDTPEIKSKYNSKAEYYGQEAKQFMRQLVQGKKVWLEGEKAQAEYDKYGRRLAYIFSEDKTFINRELVRLGYAQAIRYFPYEYKQEFILLEKGARKSILGMWKKK